MAYAIAIFIGILLGVAITLLCVRYMQSGTLKVYIPDDPEESPYLYVELDKSVGFICDQTHVMFKVNTKNIKTHQ